LRRLGLVHQIDTVAANDPGRNALLMASRFPLEPAGCEPVLPELRRWIAVDVQSPRPFLLAGIHVPNRNSGSKYQFHDAVVRELGRSRAGMGLAVGDTNTGRKGVDEETAFFSDQEDR